VPVTHHAAPHLAKVGRLSCWGCGGFGKKALILMMLISFAMPAAAEPISSAVALLAIATSWLPTITAYAGYFSMSVLFTLTMAKLKPQTFVRGLAHKLGQYWTWTRYQITNPINNWMQWFATRLFIREKRIGVSLIQLAGLITDWLSKMKGAYEQRQFYGVYEHLNRKYMHVEDKLTASLTSVNTDAELLEVLMSFKTKDDDETELYRGLDEYDSKESLHFIRVVLGLVASTLQERIASKLAIIRIGEIVLLKVLRAMGYSGRYVAPEPYFEDYALEWRQNKKRIVHEAPNTKGKNKGGKHKKLSKLQRKTKRMNGTFNRQEKTFRYKDEEYYIPQDIYEDVEKFMNEHMGDDTEAVREHHWNRTCDTYLHQEWDKYKDDLVRVRREAEKVLPAPQSVHVTTESFSEYKDMLATQLSNLLGAIQSVAQRVTGMGQQATPTVTPATPQSLPSATTLIEQTDGNQHSTGDETPITKTTKEAMVDPKNIQRSTLKADAVAYLVTKDGRKMEYKTSPLATLVSGWWYTNAHVGTEEGTKWCVKDKRYTAFNVHNYECDATRFELRDAETKKKFNPAGYTACVEDEMNISAIMVQKDPSTPAGNTEWSLQVNNGTLLGGGYHSINTTIGDCGGPLLVGNKFAGMHGGSEQTGDVAKNFYIKVSGLEKTAAGTFLQFFRR